VRVDRSTLPFLAFAAYAAVSLVMVNDPARPLLPPPLAGKIQLSELLFPVAVGAWAWAGFPGLRRVWRPTAVPAAVWVGAAVLAALASPWPGPAWRETAALLYLAVVLVWGAAVLSAPGRLRAFLRWWVLVVAAVVVVGLIGWLAAVASGQANVLIESKPMPIFGEQPRIRSTLAPTSRLLATLLILVLPAVFVLRRHGTAWERRAAAWLLPLLALCAVLTYARELLEFAALLGALALLGGARRRPVAAVALAAAYVAGFAAIQLVSAWHVTAAELTWSADPARTVRHQYYATIPGVGLESATLRVEYVPMNRLVFKQVSWRAFRERPLVGWGPDSWSRLRARGQAEGWVPAHYAFASAHGEPFTIAAEMGLLGLAGWAALWALCLGRMWRARGPGFAGGVAGASALGGAAVLLGSVNTDLMRFRFLWIALAVGLAAAACAREEVAT
jgi:hypothetical protein